MAKKIVFVLVIAAVVAGGLWAQDEQSSMEKPNTIMFLGSMVSYERSLSPKWGIGAEFALDFFGVPYLFYEGGDPKGMPYLAIVPLAIDAFANFYPWGGKFYTQLGLGFQTASIVDTFPPSGEPLTGNGFHAKVQVGWKVPLGRSSWVFQAKFGPGMSVGGVSYKGEVWGGATYFMFSFPIQLGFGMRF
jgi:hypothetical protein